MSRGYKAEHISILKDLEGVRKRPAMYIGDTGKRGLHHLVFEIVDNSVDESLAGFCNHIKVVLHRDGSVSVEDNGRGIPVDIHPEAKIPAVEVVFTKLHAGGKFKKDVYAVSGGLHGVGASVVCALSEWLEVEIYREGKMWYMKFARGKKIKSLQVKGKTNKTGTKVRFKPDPEIFETIKFEYSRIKTRLEEIAYLLPGLKIELIDEKENKREVFEFEGGLKDYVDEIDRNREAIHPTFYLHRKKNGVDVDVAIRYNKDFIDGRIISFVNVINTPEGGTHVSGLKSGLSRALMEYIKRENLLKDKIEISGEDIRVGLTSAIHVKMPDPQFEGQTKTKLGNTYIKNIVESIIYEEFLDWLYKNSQYSKSIVQKIILSAKERIAAKKARELVRRKSFLRSDVLPGKLADCISKDPRKSELFIVEGESAGGSAKQGRDRYTQAILPLKGKILNIEKTSLGKALSNEEIKAILTAIGAGYGEEGCDPSKARYHKIIIMTDADVDGSHIKTLLLTLFYRYMRPLIEEGFVYIAQPPLYRIQKGKEVYYAYSDTELKKILKKIGEDGVNIQRYKGLGEMNPEQLWETTMDPKRRVLKRVTLEDAAEAEKLVSVLMGKDTGPRKEFIEENAEEVQNLDI